jgi:hypothetical protein
MPMVADTETMPAPRLRPSRTPNDSAMITAAAESSAPAAEASVQKR